MKKSNHYWPGKMINYLLGCLVLLTSAIPTAMARVDKDTLWREAMVTVLDVDFAGTGFHARWQYHRCDCGDLLIQVEQTAPDEILTGELLLVEGQILLARGFEGQGTNITPLIQAPVLMLQLANALLNRSEPRGPFAVAEKVVWEADEPKQTFSLNTGFATGTFAAPWSVKGTGWKTDADRRRFELLFRFANPDVSGPDASSSITFTGHLDFREQGFIQGETEKLDGWRIQRFAVGEEASSPAPAGLTLKALREEAKQ